MSVKDQGAPMAAVEVAASECGDEQEAMDRQQDGDGAMAMVVVSVVYRA